MLNAHHRLASRVVKAASNRRLNTVQAISKLLPAARVFTLAVLLLVLVTGSLGAQGLTTDCYRTTLDLAGRFVPSATWSGDGRLSRLIFTDWGPKAAEQRLLSLSPGGQVSALLSDGLEPARGTALPSLVRPSQIRAIPGGFLLEDEKLPGQGNDAIYKLDESFRYLSSIPIKGRELGGGAVLSTVWGWEPFGSGVIAFGDIEYPANPPEDVWQSGYVYLGGAGNSQVIGQFRYDDPRADFPVRADHTIATIGKKAYILEMSPRPTISELNFERGGLKPLPKFPADYQRPLTFGAKVSGQGDGVSWWDNAAFLKLKDFYRSLEGSTTAIGLYSWNDKLYLLARSPLNETETAWWLLRIDPRDGSELSRVQVPSTAAHLTVVPGSIWAFIEKKPIRVWADKSGIRSDPTALVLIPASWIEDPSRGRLNGQSACRPYPGP